MGVEKVRKFLAQHAPGAEVVVHEKETATVLMAAEAFGVEPGQIAKTLSLRVNEQIILLVAAGDARLDNKKFKDYFGVKARMLDFAEVEALTGYPPGGVCPFAALDNISVYCDETLKAYDEVIPAAGSTNSGVRIAPDLLARIANATWVDVTR